MARDDFLPILKSIQRSVRVDDEGEWSKTYYPQEKTRAKPKSVGTRDIEALVGG